MLGRCDLKCFMVIMIVIWVIIVPENDQFSAVWSSIEFLDDTDTCSEAAAIISILLLISSSCSESQTNINFLLEIADTSHCNQNISLCDIRKLFQFYQKWSRPAPAWRRSVLGPVGRGNCMALRRDGKWDSFRCPNKFPYLCERSK